MLTIKLLGTPEIWLDGESPDINRRKSRAILFYLAAQAQPVTRERLLSLLWPDTPRSSAQQVLRTSLHGLRKTLGDALQVTDDSLALAPGSQVDARRFESLLASANFEAVKEAIDLYQGEFLADFYLPDSPDFESWLTLERERFQRLALRGLSRLGKEYEALGDYPSALAALERALAIAPLQEDVQRERLRLLYLSGDRAKAILSYDELRRMLDEELGVPPMIETRRLYDAILNDTLQPPSSMPARGASALTGQAALPVREAQAPPETPILSRGMRLPFTGRASELDQLTRVAARQREDQASRLVLLEGEPGIGKTRLAMEFIRASRRLALIGSSYELENSLPYQPVIEALRGLLSHALWPELKERLELPPVWLEETARLVPELSSGQPGPVPLARPEEARLWEGVLQFLRALARQQPFIFFIDDLHWADASTLALLGYLVRQNTPSILYLAASRPISSRSSLAILEENLTRTGRLERIPLARLKPDDVTALAQNLSPAYAHPFGSWLMMNSEGNPYVLVEMLHYSVEQNILSTQGDVNLSALSSTGVVPYTVYSLAQSRIDRVSDEARRVLETAVVAGREFDFEVVYQAAGLSESAALDALDELRRTGMIGPVQPAGGRSGTSLYTFDHSVTMEVAEREMGEARRRLLHRRMAHALEQLYGDKAALSRAEHEPDQALGPLTGHTAVQVFGQTTRQPAGQIAYHYIQGGEPARAAPYAFRAGQQAAELSAWKEAIDFFERALSVEEDASQRLKILTALAEARMEAGQAARASEAYRMAMALTAPGSREQAGLALGLAQSMFTQARFSEAVELAQQVAAQQRAAGGADELVMQAEFVWGTALSLEGADLEQAAEHLRQAERLCTSCAGPASLSRIKFELGGVAAQQGDLQEAVRLYREALQAAEEAGEAGRQYRILAYNNLAYHLSLLGDPSARLYAQAGLGLAQEEGFLTGQAYLLSTLGEIALAENDPQQAERLFQDGLALAERLSMPERIAGYNANLGLAALQQGQKDLAIHRLSSALARADSLGLRQLSAQVRIWLAPLLPPAEARLHLTEARAIAERGSRRFLLEQIQRLESELGPAGG